MGDPAGAGAAAGLPSSVNFFVSYTGVDEPWAVWVAWQLEAAGYTTRIQAWDFGAGAHFVTEMHRAAQHAARTVAVLSAAYLSSAYAEAEWQAAWQQDPSGEDRRLLVFRIEDCPRPGLLAQLVSVDLFDLDPDTAATRLVAAARGERGKPTVEPSFPGGGRPAGQGWARSRCSRAGCGSPTPIRTASGYTGRSNCPTLRTPPRRSTWNVTSTRRATGSGTGYGLRPGGVGSCCWSGDPRSARPAARWK
ncbi:toll/interleukin-1 receptor domain-containing protein, partial [Frankia sp. CpI1-P]